MFALTVANTNDAPMVGSALTVQVANEDSAFVYALPADAFTEVDIGDRLTYTAMLANGDTLPAWLKLDTQTGVFSGMPGNDDVGALQIRVTAVDLAGAQASQVFDLVVANTNDAPEAAIELADQQAFEDAPFAFTLPEDVFVDSDAGDVLSLSATQADGSALPTWLSFDVATRTFSGMPTNDDVGTLQVRVTASDLTGEQANQTFAIAVANVNDAPEAAVPLANQTVPVGEAVSWQLPDGAFVDVDPGDMLTYSASLADGNALPEWLSFDAATGSFSGTPTTAGNYAIQVSATDLSGTQAYQTFSLDVTPGEDNQAPITAPDTAVVIEDLKPLAWGNVLANDHDPEGSTLHVADAGFKGGEYGMLILEADGDYAYTINNWSSKVQALGSDESVVDRFAYLASDGTSLNSGELAITVLGINDAPELAHRLEDVQLAKGKDFSWAISAGSFIDRDRNDTLAYTATLSNGRPLPAWLKFDAATQTFSGTVPANAKSSIDVRVTASDGHGECSSASDVFKISFGSKTVLPPDRKGNEGDGNRHDMPTPGHDFNYNDGHGTSPRQPDHRHGSGRDDDSLVRFLDGFKTDGKSTYAKLQVLDRTWYAQLGEQPRPFERSGQSSGNDEFERHWSALAYALNRLDAERRGAPAWNHVNQGADLSGLAGFIQGGAYAARTGVDSISLSCGNGTQLKTFTGLHEGFGRLPW